MEREFTPERISALEPNEIFVFGSNLYGSHGGGAAALAYQRFGAKWGQAEGLQGHSYALPTVFAKASEIAPYAERFIECAKSHPELKFYLTEVGCGIAGFKVTEIAPLFAAALNVPNIVLPKRFFEVLMATNPQE